MKIPLLFRTVEEAQKAVFLMLYCLVGVVTIAVVTAISAVTNNKPVDRLIPPHLDKAVEVGWSSASSDYLKSVGLYFATLVGNITPKNVQFVSESLAAMVAPDLYPQVKKRLLQVGTDQTFQQTASNVRFLPQYVHHESDKNKVFVTGDFMSRNAVGTGEEGKRITYELQIRMSEGRPWIVSVDSYSGEAHTKKWLEQHPEYEEEVKQQKIKDGQTS